MMRVLAAFARRHSTPHRHRSWRCGVEWVNPDIGYADEAGFAEGWNESRQYAITKGVIPPVVKGISAHCRGWNAFSAVMLKAGPVTGWIKCSERMPDAGSEQRVFAYTPSPHIDVRFRMVNASMFKQVCRDATHWQYVVAPELEG